MNLKVKITNIGDINVTVQDQDTVLSLKNEIVKIHSNLNPSHIRIIFRGQILKDENTLSSRQLTDGCAVHGVVSEPPPLEDEPLPDPWESPQAPASLPGMDFTGMMPPGMTPPGMTSEQMQSIMSNPMFQQFTSQVMSNPQSMSRLMNISQRLNTGELNYSNIMNDPEYREIFSNSGSSLNTAPRFEAAAPQQPFPAIEEDSTVDYKELYKSQLAQLAELGFTNEETNIEILKTCQGNIDIAADRLLG